MVKCGDRFRTWESSLKTWKCRREASRLKFQRIFRNSSGNYCFKKMPLDELSRKSLVNNIVQTEDFPVWILIKFPGLGYLHRYVDQAKTISTLKRQLFPRIITADERLCPIHLVYFDLGIIVFLRKFMFICWKYCHMLLWRFYCTLFSRMIEVVKCKIWNYVCSKLPQHRKFFKFHFHTRWLFHL